MPRFFDDTDMTPNSMCSKDGRTVNDTRGLHIFESAISSTPQGSILMRRMSRLRDGDVAATCAMVGIGDSIHDPSGLQRIDAQMVNSVRFGRREMSRCGGYAIFNFTCGGG